MADTKKKKPKRAKPNSLAIADLKLMGFLPWTVESRIPTTWITQDCYGFGDILACRPGFGVLLVQATSGGGSGKSNVNARFRKCIAEPRLRTWLQSGGRMELWNYTPTDETRKKFTLHRQEIKLEDLPPVVETAPTDSMFTLA